MRTDAAGTQFAGWYRLAKGAGNGEPKFPAAPQVAGMANAACPAGRGTAALPAYVIGSPH